MPSALPPVPAPQPSVRLSSKSIGPTSADVIGRLTVRDRAVAERDLAALIAGVGAVETSRREEGATTVLEVAVPRDRYAAFQEKLERLGAWHAETSSPGLPDRVRVTLRIGQ
jgi:hypothetical protein